MYTLFDLEREIKEIESKESSLVNETEVVSLKTTKECDKEQEEYLKHLDNLRKTLYKDMTPEDIRKNSYVGRRMNTDFRKIKNRLSIENETKESDKEDSNLEEIRVEEMKVEEMNVAKDSSEGKLLIIDGSSLLSTAYHANLPNDYRFAKTDEEKALAEKKIMNVDGFYTNGIYTAMRTLLFDLLKDKNITHIAVTLDISRNSFRKKFIYPDYKANRKETDPKLKAQFPVFKEILENIGITVFESDINDEIIYEADDFSGSLVEKFSNDIKVVMYSKDRDYYQLINENTSLICRTDKYEELLKMCNMTGENLPNRSFEYTLETLPITENIAPNKVVDYKALAGETGPSSDNIPGVKGVSDITAKELINYYGSLEAIYEAIEPLDKNGRDALGKHLVSEVLTTTRSPINALLKYKENAFLSRKLSKIKTDIDLKCTLDDLRLNINKEALREELEKYKMKSLLKGSI